MDVRLFDFDLPGELVALRPAVPRDSARMLVVHPGNPLQHARVGDLANFLRSGDVLVFNDTRVIPARLRGHRVSRTGGGPGSRIEVLLHRRAAPSVFSAFARPAKRLVAGDRLQLGASLSATVIARGEGGEVVLHFALSGPALDAAIAGEGEVPLPPYIAGKRKADARDVVDYQTIYAQTDGSVAAPTAGLHFTPELLERLRTAGTEFSFVTLHIGAGTFQPVKTEDTALHAMHPEWAVLTPETAARLNQVREMGGRIIAVGTTVLRVLESAVLDDGRLASFCGETEIFMTPGHQFRTADALLTNFHLPRSTLFMLVSAFSGLDTMQNGYREAIKERYRFYSYGDACLLFRKP